MCILNGMAQIYHEHVLSGSRYWSDDQQIRAVLLDVGQVELFGTYACVNGEMRKTIDILGEWYVSVLWHA